MHDLESDVVVLALRTWRYYLFRNVVHIYTDHKSLKYIFTQANLNMRQKRWLKLIKDYDLELHYHPEKAKCQTQFLCQNQVLIICMTQDQLFHRYSQQCSQITKCHK
jgi:hypothetical protein